MVNCINQHGITSNYSHQKRNLINLICPAICMTSFPMVRPIIFANRVYLSDEGTLKKTQNI